MRQVCPLLVLCSWWPFHCRRLVYNGVSLSISSTCFSMHSHCRLKFILKLGTQHPLSCPHLTVSCLYPRGANWFIEQCHKPNYSVASLCCVHQNRSGLLLIPQDVLLQRDFIGCCCVHIAVCSMIHRCYCGWKCAILYEVLWVTIISPHRWNISILWCEIIKDYSIPYCVWH